MARNHQPDQSTFRAVLPEDIDWQPFPAFPSGARLAVMVGHPAEAGPYVVRVKVPGGTKLMPHRHPEDRIYTVMSGIFYIGLGETFDGDKVTAVSSCCRATPGISIGQSPASTSPRFQRSARSASNITTCMTIRVRKVTARDRSETRSSRPDTGRKITCRCFGSIYLKAAVPIN